MKHTKLKCPTGEEDKKMITQQTLEDSVIMANTYSEHKWIVPF